MSNQSSLRGLYCLMAFKGNTAARRRTPPPPDGGWRYQLSSGRSCGGRQSEPPKPHSPTPTQRQNPPSWSADRGCDGVGGIAFSLISCGDIQTAGCCQKFTTTRLPWGRGAFQENGVHWCGESNTLSTCGPLYHVSLVPKLGMGMTSMRASNLGLVLASARVSWPDCNAI